MGSAGVTELKSEVMEYLHLSGFKSGNNAQVPWGGPLGAAGGPSHPRVPPMGRFRPVEVPHGHKLVLVDNGILRRTFDSYLTVWDS